MRILVVALTLFSIGCLKAGTAFAEVHPSHKKHRHHRSHQTHFHHAHFHKTHVVHGTLHRAQSYHEVSAIPTIQAKTGEVKAETPFSVENQSSQSWLGTHWHNPHLIRRSLVFASNTEHSLVALVHTAIARLHHTAYRYGGNYFNMSQGIYEVDCSDYVDDLLRISQPKAYADLADSTHTAKPNSTDYYRFFNHLSENSGHAWQKVDDVEALKAGDVLVFQNYGGGGHVMVVMDSPTPAQDDSSTYFVRVSDSAYSRHSDDTRPPHASGIGIGTLLLKADPQTGQPRAYAWTVDSGWKHNVRVAMAEPTIEA